jgi:hypothetical protein
MRSLKPKGRKNPGDFLLLSIVLSLLSFSVCLGAPLTIDISGNIPAPAACPYGPGTSTNPAGQSITLDQRSFLLSGKPWIPIAGEFHFSRYEQSEWRDELLKMKAGGLNTVSAYVFWIHHEDVKGQFDWAGNKSLHRFVSLCAEAGLKVILRLGPWDHGECRNGGFPDWVKRSDPRFMDYVRELYKEEANQVKGLLWKEGGPVIGVQLDNETANTKYLLDLKKLAIDAGIDVPFYTMTGWQGGVPRSGLVPMFGGYSQGFWGGDMRKEFMITPNRTGHDLGAQGSQADASEEIVEQFPYACAENGGGMMSSHRTRIQIQPDDIAALSLCKLADGNNMPGYYMFQGGFNPGSPLHTLQEDHPNEMPVINYDFQAPIGMNGEVREHFHLLRELHLFLGQFGSAFAQAVPFLPDVRPADLNDVATLNWDIRYDGTTGYLFFNNYRNNHPFDAHPEVQFSIKTKAGTVLVPRHPVTIPKGAYGFWPFHWDCDGVMLDYATVQPLCRIPDSNGEAVYFFTQIRNINPEMALNGAEPVTVTPSTSYAKSVKNAAGKTVHFVVLPTGAGERLYRVQLAGVNRAVLSDAVVAGEEDQLRLYSPSPDLSISIFPPIPDLKLAGKSASNFKDGIFAKFEASLPHPQPVSIGFKETKAGQPALPNGNGTDEATWQGAAEYSLTIPNTADEQRHLVLVLSYKGDAARVYDADHLLMDDFFNGNPLDIALWRIPAGDWPHLRVLIAPNKKNVAELQSVETAEQFECDARIP